MVDKEQLEKKIFIVNDDKQLLDMYSLEFKAQGFDVVPAYGSVDAIEKLRGGIEPGVILIDVTAPIMDSIELLEIIRAEKLSPDAKVVILSNESRSTLDEKSRALGVNGYIEKTSTTPAQVVQDVQEIKNIPMVTSDNI